MDRSVLARKPMTELKDIASHLNMRGYQKLRKAELIDAIVESATGQASAANGAADPASDDDGGRRTTRTRTRSATTRGGDQADAADTADQDSADRGHSDSDTARKVLPPGARETDEPDGGEASAGERGEGRDRQSGKGGARGDDESRGRNGNGARKSRGRGQSADDTTDRDGGREDEPSDSGSGQSGRSAKSGGQGRSDGSGKSGGGSGKSGGGSGKSNGGSGKSDGGSGKPDGGSNKSNGKNGGRDQESGDSGDQSESDGDTDEESSASRKRRSRRDRRKRNRERNEQEGQQGNEPGEVRAGVLDILPEGYGFLRTTGYLPGDRDVYVSQGQIRKHALRRGDVVQGPIRQQRNNEKVPALHHVQKVNGGELESGRVADRVEFRDLVPVYPSEQMFLETDRGPTVLRAIDLLAPIGRGQRALLLAPPAAGRTDVLKGMGQAIATNNPDAHLMVVLIDERPEDVTDVQRAIPGEVIASTFDRPVEDHTQIAELAMERARRLVELGHDVVVLVDSLTRLARAYGGGAVDATSLYPAKRFFGTARNIEDGGSLTIIAAVLTESGSTTDDLIADEFLGAANTVIALDGDVAPHLRPAIRVDLSATRREELLVPDEDLSAIWQVRRGLAEVPHQESTKTFTERLAASDDNESFLDGVEPAVDRHATMGTT